MLAEEIRKPIDPMELVYPKELPLFDKYDEYLPEELVKKEKLDLKVCRQYALDEYAENIVLLDTGYAKIMTPFFDLDSLRRVPGFENARYADPYAGGKGNSVRYLSVTERDNDMRVTGTETCSAEVKSQAFSWAIRRR